MQPRDSPLCVSSEAIQSRQPNQPVHNTRARRQRWSIRVPLMPRCQYCCTRHLPDDAIPHKGNGSNYDFMDASAELFQSIYGSALPHRYPRRLVGRFILRHDNMVARLPIRKLPSRQNGASTTRPRLPILHKIIKLLQLNKSGRPPKGVSGQIF